MELIAHKVVVEEELAIFKTEIASCYNPVYIHLNFEKCIRA